MDKTTNTKPFQAGFWLKFWRLIRRHHRKIYTSMVLMAVMGFTDVIENMITRYAIDHFIVDRQFDTLPWFILGLVVFVLVIAGVVYGQVLLNRQVEMDVAYDLREKAMAKLSILPFSYYDKNASGWIVARVTSDISRLTEIVAYWLSDAFWGLAVMVGVLVLLIFNYPLMAVVLLISLPIFGLVSYFFPRWLLTFWRQVRKANSQITADFSEGILGAKTTKTMSLEDLHYQEFQDHTNHMYKISMRAMTLNALYRPLIMLLISCVIGLVMVESGGRALLGTMSIGTFMMVIGLVIRFFFPMATLAGLLSELQQAQANAERVLGLLDHPVEIVDRPEVEAAYGTILQPTDKVNEPLVGDIDFDHVTFYYKPEEVILEDFNLHIKEGQSVALVGKTGSGKTTIANLLCRFYEPVSGQILLDGKPLDDRSIGWLHNHLGYVLQDPHLFSGTIMDNLRFGKKEASDQEIIEICKTLKAHSMIMSLPQGYQTQVGQGGALLSTGQKQMVALVRAMVHDPALVVLDEATANIDSQTEKILQEAVNHLIQGRTCLVIAHRLSTVEACDLILVLDQGKIIEQGSHQDLLAQKGRYYQLVTNQFREEEDDA